MVVKKINLISCEKVKIDEVINNLLSQKFGTKWAEKTNDPAINYIKHLGEVYGDVWYKGFLPKELLSEILLPEHPTTFRHNGENGESISFFHLDTLIKDAVMIIREINKAKQEDKKGCLDLINYLKNEIKKNGFTSSIVLAVINGTLKHVDGLHRLMALELLLEEGYEYQPISVYLCDSTRGKK